MYLPEPRLEISQGDIFDHLPLVSVVHADEASEITTTIRAGRAILLTQDCEYDKPSNPWIVVAEVRPLSEIAPGSQGHVRAYRTRNTFYLAPYAHDMPESYVDFRRLTRLPKSVLTSTSGDVLRFASLTGEAQTALQRQIALFFGYGR